MRPCMITAFLDDTGTHERSRVVAWGGVIGAQENVVNLDAPWRFRLQHPCEGPARRYPPSEAPTAMEASASSRDYRPVERDHTRHLYRQEIHASGVAMLACGVDRAAWHSIIPEDHPHFRPKRSLRFVPSGCV